MNRLASLLFLWFFTTFAVAQTRGLPDFSELAERQGPAVVNISTTQVIRGQAQMMPFPFDESDPAFEFFKRFIPRTPGGGIPRDFENKSLGSGFIISGDGYILTNAHVVDGADEVTVRLTDKREFKARIIGADKRTDIALVKIEAAGLPAVKLADPGQLKVGEWVVAIGSPFGFDNSVTAGIVSAKGRSLPQENYVPFIQTDVAINPGNSGGPLFNMRGEVVGINSQIYSRSGGFMGISFAIPMDEAIRVSEQLRASGRVTRGRIGVQIGQVTKDVAESIGLGKASGALVTGVESGSPAEKAGIEAGDIITRFDGKAIDKLADLPRLVGNTKPGTKSTVTVFRRGTAKDLSLTIAEIEGDKPVRKAAERAAINAPMQGTAADIIKRAMIAVDGWIRGITDGSIHMLMQVHDELVFEIREEKLEEYIALIKEKMSAAAELHVPLVVEAGTGDNWDQAH